MSYGHVGYGLTITDYASAFFLGLLGRHLYRLSLSMHVYMYPAGKLDRKGPLHMYRRMQMPLKP